MKKDQELKKKRKRQQDRNNQKSNKKRKTQIDFEEEEEEGNDSYFNDDLDDSTDSESAIDTLKYQRVMKKFKAVALKCKQDEDLLEELDNFILRISKSGIGDDNENNEYSQKNSVKLLSNEPRVHHKRLKLWTDNRAVGLLLKELNKTYNDCLSLRQNTERTIEINLDKLLKNNLNNTGDLKELVRLITIHPDVTIILTNLPDIGDDMLSILKNSRFGKHPNAHLRLFCKGTFLGNTTNLFSLNHVLDTCQLSTSDVRDVKYEIAKDDGTREVVDMQGNELSLYFSDISTDRANPGMMEMYKNAMPKVIKDLLPYEMNDFSKYLHGQNKSDQPGPNIYVATKDAFTGLHVDNSYAVLAVHHNLIGTNKVTIFRALNDIESAESFWNGYKQCSREAGLIDQQPDNDIFDIVKYSSSHMSDEMIRSMEGETFLLKKNEVLLISCGRPHVFQKMGCYDSIHFSIAWDIIAFDIQHEDMFTMDLMRGLMFSAEKCKRCREALGELEVEPDISYVRSCLMNYLLKAPLHIPQAFMFPLYVLVREQLEYKLLCIHHNIKEICEDMFPEAKSYYCDTCGLDLCNAYFISKQKQNDAVGNTFCSHCIEMALLDQAFVENNRENLADVLKGTKKQPRLHPESSLILMYRYMDIDDLLSMCGLYPSNVAKVGSTFYESFYESLRDVENFPTESTAKQICKISDDNVIQGKGLVAIRDISANTFIAELKGDIKPRGEVKHDKVYCADLHDDKVIDPHETHCLAKYVNHSCQPNATLMVNTPKHVFIVSGKEPILAGTEITVDYGNNRHDFFEACLCPLCKKKHLKHRCRKNV